MKVALCLSGQPRKFAECWDSIYANLISPYKTDVFFHFWNHNIPELSDTFKSVVKGYYLSEQYLFDDSPYFEGCTPENSRMQSKSFQSVLSMYSSIQLANYIKWHFEQQNNFRYDIIIRCRTDAKFSRSPQLIIDDAIHVPNFETWGGYNDQFAYGNSQNMDIYSRCFNYIPTHFENGGNFHPETILKRYLNSRKVKVIEEPFPYILENIKE